MLWSGAETPLGQLPDRRKRKVDVQADRDNAQLTLTVTSTDLLRGLERSDNRQVWQQFVDRYRPLIVRYAQKVAGMPADDADEAAQASLIAFAEAYQRGCYDREKGRLRKWLFGIATNQIKNLARKRALNREVQIPDGTTGMGFMSGIIDDDSELEKKWEEDWRQGAYQQCLLEVRGHFDAKTVEAFVQYAQKGRPAQEVAQELGISRNAVFLAKHKILKRIRELIPVMEEAW